MPVERRARATDDPSPMPTTRSFVTTSWDDGHIYDLALANLLDDYELPGTFYIAPRNIELAPRARLHDRDIATLASRFEIGGHTLTHLRLTTLPEKEAAAEIASGKRYLEDCIGQPITSFCYPGGEYSPLHPAMVRSAGFTLARTVERHRIDRPSALMEVPTSFHAYRHLRDGPAALRMTGGDPVRAGRYYLHWDEWAIALFERVLVFGGVFHLWGHSWELEERHDWDRLERVLAHISRRSDVTYVRNNGLSRFGDHGVSAAS
jgi:peptidoglycan/xylan/chitin deacetylase (PgdA/CDA1 family)